MSRLAAKFYVDCIRRDVAPHFLVPYLLCRTDFLPEVKKEVIFDLGFDLRDGEREFIQALSRDTKITVLIPANNPEELKSRGLNAYRNFDLGLVNVSNENANTKLLRETKTSLWRCSSPEAEARQAVEQIRELD